MATKRSDPNYSQVSGYVPKDLALRFRVACTAKEKSQSEVLEKALILWLEQNEQTPSALTKNQGMV